MHKPIHNAGRLGLALILANVALALLVSPGLTQPIQDTALSLPYHNYDRPVQAESYLIRPQEKLIVYFVGTKLPPLTLAVNADGKLVDASLGVFELAGKSLAEVREMIAPAIRKAYTAAAFEITVSGPYRVAITLTGAVTRPGIYIGYTSNYVSELLDLAGGLLPTASRRHIEFLGGPKALRVDLDRAVYFGDWTADPCLYAGFRIYVPQRSDRIVHIVGEVQNPREIEIVPGDTLGELLAFAGGPTVDADLSAIAFSGDSAGARSLSDQLSPGMVVIVPEKGNQPGSTGSLSIFGAVKSPGLFPLAPGLVLGDLLTHAGGLAPAANRNRVTVFRRVTGETRLASSHERFPITVGNPESTSQFVLRTGDSVFVPFLVGFVEVAGRVRFPGLFPYSSGQNASYYIRLAGGFLADADRQDLDITDRVSRQTHSGGPDSGVGDGDLLTIRLKENLP